MTVADESESVYQRVLGRAFTDLDPQLQTYFGSIPAGFVGEGAGRFHEAGLRVRALRPLFALLGRRGIAFAEFGVGVPFTVRNVPSANGTLRATRAFRFATGTRHMTDTLRVTDGRLIDRIGKRGEIEIELQAQVSGGGLRLESRPLALRMLGLRIPLPPVMRVHLREDAGGEQDGTQDVRVSITAGILGEIYGYHGAFTYDIRPAAGALTAPHPRFKRGDPTESGPDAAS